MNIGVVDYGMGNLHSVAKALATTGSHVNVTDDKSKLRVTDMLVVPGVGSFGAAMTNLAKKHLDDFVSSWIADDRPFLGICLGLQLLFERSEESPKIPGLGVFKGSVVRFSDKKLKGLGFQVPHMGWNTLNVKQNEKLGVSKSDFFYFVHSYFPAPMDKKIIWTETNYGSPFCSAIRKGNVMATQFHPEKSGEVGLRLLKNIVSQFQKTSPFRERVG